MWKAGRYTNRKQKIHWTFPDTASGNTHKLAFDSSPYKQLEILLEKVLNNQPVNAGKYLIHLPKVPRTKIKLTCKYDS